MSTDERIARARRFLEGIGITRATVEVEGHQREIVALRVSAESWERVMEDRVRIAAFANEAGFRYVSVDLRPLDDPAPA